MPKRIDRIAKDGQFWRNATKIVAFTGHRPKTLGTSYNMKDPKSRAIAQRVASFLHEMLFQGYKPYCISGMALGFDQLAVAACIKEKVPFEAAIPCDQQDSRWFDETRAIYRALISRADRVITLYDSYSISVMLERNRYMLEGDGERPAANVLLACWNPEVYKGGTVHMVNLAKRKGIEVVNVYPT